MPNAQRSYSKFTRDYYAQAMPATELPVQAKNNSVCVKLLQNNYKIAVLQPFISCHFIGVQDILFFGPDGPATLSTGPAAAARAGGAHQV